MSGKSHITAAIVAATATSTYLVSLDFKSPEFAIATSFAIFGGLLPDVDHANSKLGNKIPILPLLFKHRGFTHTIWCMLICTFLMSLLFNKIHTIYFAAGYISHIIADLLTPAGIRLIKIGPLFDFTIKIPIIFNKFIEETVNYAMMFTVALLIV